MKTRLPMAVGKSPTGASPHGSFWLLVPLCLAVFAFSGLLYYQYSTGGVGEPSNWLQGLVVWLYGLLGFAPALTLCLLLVCWTTIWFLTGDVKDPGGRLWRLLAFTLALAVLSNLRPEPDGGVSPGAGWLGVFLAGGLRNTLGYPFSTLIMVLVTLPALLLATDFLFYRYFEGASTPVQAPAGTGSGTGIRATDTRATGTRAHSEDRTPQPQARGVGHGRQTPIEEGVENEATDVFKTLGEALGAAAVEPREAERRREQRSRNAEFEVEDLMAAVEATHEEGPDLDSSPLAPDSRGGAEASDPSGELSEDGASEDASNELPAGPSEGFYPHGDAPTDGPTEAPTDGAGTGSDDGGEALEPVSLGLDDLELALDEEALAELAREAMDERGTVDSDPDRDGSAQREEQKGEPDEATAVASAEDSSATVHSGPEVADATSSGVDSVDSDELEFLAPQPPEDQEIELPEVEWSEGRLDRPVQESVHDESQHGWIDAAQDASGEHQAVPHQVAEASAADEPNPGPANSADESEAEPDRTAGQLPFGGLLDGEVADAAVPAPASSEDGQAVEREEERGSLPRHAQPPTGAELLGGDTPDVEGEVSADNDEAAMDPAEGEDVAFAPAQSNLESSTSTGPADTGLADTGPADTGLADTGLADTGPADTGPADADPETSHEPVNGGTAGAGEEPSETLEPASLDASSHPDVVIPRPDHEPVPAPAEPRDTTDNPLVAEAEELVRRTGRATVNTLHRRLGVDRDTALTLLEALRDRGVIRLEAGAQQGELV